MDHGVMNRRKIPTPTQLPGGYCGLYVLGPACGTPVKVGFARVPKSRLNINQLDFPEPLDVLYLVWVVDVTVARRVITRFRANLRAIGRKADDWLDISARHAGRLIAEAAKTEGIPTYTDAETRKISRLEEERQLQRLMRIA